MKVADDKNVFRCVRIRPAEEDTSVRAVTRPPEPHAGAAGRRQAALQRLLLLADIAKTARGVTRWTRDELYDC